MRFLRRYGLPTANTMRWQNQRASSIIFERAVPIASWVYLVTAKKIDIGRVVEAPGPESQLYGLLEIQD
jgi:hypothetical protein